MIHYRSSAALELIAREVNSLSGELPISAAGHLFAHLAK